MKGSCWLLRVPAGTKEGFCWVPAVPPRVRNELEGSCLAIKSSCQNTNEFLLEFSHSRRVPAGSEEFLPSFKCSKESSC